MSRAAQKLMFTLEVSVPLWHMFAGPNGEDLATSDPRCYAKAIGLDKEKEPDIYNAIRSGAPASEEISTRSYFHLSLRLQSRERGGLCAESSRDSTEMPEAEPERYF